MIQIGGFLTAQLVIHCVGSALPVAPYGLTALRVVKVQPKRGPAYYLQDRNGDGRPDDDKVSPVYFKLFGW